MPWHVTGVIDYHVPAPTGQCVQFGVAIAYQRFEIGEQGVIGATAIEQGYAMTPPQSLAHHVWPDKTGASKKQNGQRLVPKSLGSYMLNCRPSANSASA